MLPEALSNGLCSLRPDEDRLTFAAFMEISRDGKIRKSRFAKCIIRSARRFTYKEAFARLQVAPADKFDHMLHEAWAMASTLRKKRFEEGSLDLDFPEVKVWLDDQGRPARLERIENDISHQLIEECMLEANEAVARLFRMTPAAAIHRVHEKPDEAKLNEYRERVQMHGHKVGNLSVRKELTRFLKMLRGQPEEYALKTALLKSLKRASYSPEPAGHYGLAKSDYTHFTSPIRRYADLIVHRVLSDVCGYTKPKGRIPFGEIARHISTTERNAAEAEREAVRLKKFEFFRQQLAKKTGQTFKAIVLEVRNFGMFVELPEVMAGGLIHVSALGDDFYTFDQARQRFIGRKKKKTFKAGDELEVVVARVDPFKQQLDFAPA
jgi:ribonuclease R